MPSQNGPSDAPCERLSLFQQAFFPQRIEGAQVDFGDSRFHSQFLQTHFMLFTAKRICGWFGGNPGALKFLEQKLSIEDAKPQGRHGVMPKEPADELGLRLDVIREWFDGLDFVEQVANEERSPRQVNLIGTIRSPFPVPRQQGRKIVEKDIGFVVLVAMLNPQRLRFIVKPIRESYRVRINRLSTRAAVFVLMDLFQQED